MSEMYVIQKGSMLELRQTRFREQLNAGIEHPHDVCAVARSVEEMRGMVDKHWPDIDYSAVENQAVCRQAETPEDLSVFRESQSASPAADSVRKHLKI